MYVQRYSKFSGEHPTVGIKKDSIFFNKVYAQFISKIYIRYYIFVANIL